MASHVILDKPGRARVYDTILDTIGNTPLVRIGRLAREAGCQGEVLANAMIPVITILGIVFGFLMAGNAVVESVFAWPGIGNYAITSLMTKDSGPIQSFVLFVALLYVSVNFIIDILYGLIDPRIRLE